MDSAALAILSAIKTTIYWLLFVAVIGALANSIRAWAAVRGIMEKERDSLFTNHAELLYEKGEFDQLLDYCDSELKRRPNRALALWYQAKAYYRKGNHAKAKELLESLDRAEPSWSASHVQPYLAKIRAIEGENPNPPT